MSNQPNIIMLNFKGCKNLYDIHQMLKIAFDFPDWYGENWDAFWDLLREPRDYTLVQVHGLSSLPSDLKKHAQTVIELLEENKVHFQEFMKKQAKFDRRFDYEIVN